MKEVRADIVIDSILSLTQAPVEVFNKILVGLSGSICLAYHYLSNSRSRD